MPRLGTRAAVAARPSERTVHATMDDAMAASSASSWTVLLLDQDNVRASAGWPPAKTFRERVAKIYSLDPRHTRTILIIAVDEKRQCVHTARRKTAEKIARAPTNLT